MSSSTTLYFYFLANHTQAYIPFHPYMTFCSFQALAAVFRYSRVDGSELSENQGQEETELLIIGRHKFLA